MLRRLVCALGLGVGAFVVGVPGWIVLNLADAPRPDDLDLRVDRPEVAEGDNGYVLYRAAAVASVGVSEPEIYRPLDEILRGERSDPKWVEQLARDNAAAFGLLERALRAPRFVFPRGDVKGDHGLGDFMAIQHLVRIAAAESRWLGRVGDADGALERASLGLKVGRRVSGAIGVDLLALIHSRVYQSIGLRAI